MIMFTETEIQDIISLDLQQLGAPMDMDLPQDLIDNFRNQTEVFLHKADKILDACCASDFELHDGAKNYIKMHKHDIEFGGNALLLSVPSNLIPEEEATREHCGFIRYQVSDTETITIRFEVSYIRISSTKLYLIVNSHTENHEDCFSLIAQAIESVRERLPHGPIRNQAQMYRSLMSYICRLLYMNNFSENDIPAIVAIFKEIAEWVGGEVNAEPVPATSGIEGGNSDKMYFYCSMLDDSTSQTLVNLVSLLPVCPVDESWHFEEDACSVTCSVEHN